MLRRIGLLVALSCTACGHANPSTAGATDDQIRRIQTDEAVLARANVAVSRTESSCTDRCAPVPDAQNARHSICSIAVDVVDADVRARCDHATTSLLQIEATAFSSCECEGMTRTEAAPHD